MKYFTKNYILTKDLSRKNLEIFFIFFRNIFRFTRESICEPLINKFQQIVTYCLETCVKMIDPAWQYYLSSYNASVSKSPASFYQRRKMHEVTFCFPF